MSLANGRTHRIGMRWLILISLAYWLLVCAYMLMHGEELDFDAVFPFAGQETMTVTSYGPTSPPNPPASVVAAFWTIGIIVGLPIAFAGRAAAIALRISTIAVGVCLLVSILRLGILLTPVLALQLLAHSRFDTARHS